jgi:hypothetical protein
MMMNIKKIKSKTIATLVSTLFVLTPSIGFAAGAMQDWPVHDQANGEKIDALGAHFGNLAQSNKISAESEVRNTKAINMTQGILSTLEQQRKVILDAAPTLDKCISITNAMGAGNMQGAVRQNAEAISRNLSQVQNAQGNDNLNSVTKSSSELKTCSEQDVRAGIAGCKVEGKYANMDTNSTVVKINSLNGSYSLPPEQLAVAQQYIKNVVYANAPAQLDATRGANSELYNALRKIWYGRVSPVSNALQFQLWYSAGMDLSNNASAQAMWTGEEMVAAYRNTHGGLEPPKNPSMKDIINTMVNRDMFFSKTAADGQAQSTEELLRTLNQRMALNNYLLAYKAEMDGYISDQLGMIVMGIHSPQTNDINQTAQAGN